MSNNGQERSNPENEAGFRSEDLNSSPMMVHLMDALKAGQDIGHYGRLTFVMVARHFLPDDELVELLLGQPGMDEREARTLLAQVNARGYNPPSRERILEWQELQEFPICPDAEDPNACNVYRELQFPDEIYENINDFWEEKVEADE